jgi:hypothetical protein
LSTLGGKTPSWIRVWSLIHNKKNPIVLFERNCHATEKSEMPVINREVDPKRMSEKMMGRGGGGAQGVTEQKIK